MMKIEVVSELCQIVQVAEQGPRGPMGGLFAPLEYDLEKSYDYREKCLTIGGDEYYSLIPDNKGRPPFDGQAWAKLQRRESAYRVYASSYNVTTPQYLILQAHVENPVKTVSKVEYLNSDTGVVVGESDPTDIFGGVGVAITSADNGVVRYIARVIYASGGTMPQGDPRAIAVVTIAIP